MATKAHKAKSWFIQALQQTNPDQQDRYGNFKNATGDVRVKINKTSWRLERKVSDRWIKTSGNYYTRTTWAGVYALRDRLNK